MFRKLKARLASSGGIPLWVLLLLIGLLFFQIRGVNTTSDASWYIARGLNLYQGLGYVESDWSPSIIRGPVFPGLIAAFFWLFGVSVKSALWVTRLFFVLNVGAVYAIGSRLSGRITGLIAASLVLTSFTIHRWSSYVLLDDVLPFFLLLASLLLFIGLEKRSGVYCGLAGLTVGVAFLTKDVAVLFLPLPILVWIMVPGYRTRGFWRRALIFWCIALAAMIPWVVHVYWVNGGSYPAFAGATSAIGGMLSGEESSLAFLPTIARGVGKLWRWLSNYYRRYLVANFELAALFLLAWGYVAFRAVVKRSRADGLLVSGLIPFLPIVLLQGKSGLRAGQSLYMFLLSYLALAYLLRALETDILRARTRGMLSLALAVLALGAQVWGGSRGFVHFLAGLEPSGFVRKAGVYAPSLGRVGWEVGGSHNQYVRDACEWLKDNAEPGDPILMDWMWSDAVYFYLDARYPVHKICYTSSENIQYSTAAGSGCPSDQAPLVHSLFVWPQAGRTNPAASDTFLNALSEDAFLEQINGLGPRYVIVTPRRNFLSLYLRANTAFEEVRQFGDGQIQIFTVRDRVSPIDFPTHIEPATAEYMRRAARQDPALYERVVADFFMEDLDWTEARLEALVNGDGHSVPVRVNQIYSWQNQAKALLEAEQLETAIAAYERAIDLEPDNVQLYAELARTYQADSQPEKALAVFKAAMLLWPDLGTAELFSPYLGVAPMYLPVYLQEGADDVAERHEVEERPEGNAFEVGRTYEGRGQLDEALAHYLAAAEMESRRSVRAMLLEKAGQIYEAEGQLDKAIAQYLSGADIVSEAGQMRALYGRAVDLYLAADNPEAARILVRNVLRNRRKYAGAWLLAADVYPALIACYEAQGETVRAKAVAQEFWSYDFVEHFDTAEIEAAKEPFPRVRVAEFAMPNTDDRQAVLSMFPEARVSYKLEAPLEPSVLLFTPVMNPEAWDPGGDGAVFEIHLTDEERVHRLLFSEHIGRNPEQQKWHAQKVSLTPYAGQEVTITFVTQPGPEGDFTGDEAAWVTPRVVGVRAEPRWIWERAQEFFSSLVLRRFPQFFVKLYPLG